MKSLPREIANRVMIVGGLPGRNIPEIARDVEHVQQETRVVRDLPARIKYLILIARFVGHSMTRRLLSSAKSRGVKVYITHGSRSSVERLIREEVLPAENAR